VTVHGVAAWLVGQVGMAKPGVMRAAAPYERGIYATTGRTVQTLHAVDVRLAPINAAVMSPRRFPRLMHLRVSAVVDTNQYSGDRANRTHVHEPRLTLNHEWAPNSQARRAPWKAFLRPKPREMLHIRQSGYLSTYAHNIYYVK
jgi:hypothetical protein